MHVNSASVNLCGRLGQIYHLAVGRGFYFQTVCFLSNGPEPHTFQTKFSTIQRLINRKAIRTRSNSCRCLLPSKYSALQFPLGCALVNIRIRFISLSSLDVCFYYLHSIYIMKVSAFALSLVFFERFCIILA